MSEDESFVILGTSPTESMENYSIIQKLINKNDAGAGPVLNSLSDEEKKEEQQSSMLSLGTDVLKTNSFIFAENTISTISKSSKLWDNNRSSQQNGDVSKTSGQYNGNLANGSQDSVKAGPAMSTNNFGSASPKNSLLDSKNGSLATSFLLGEVELDVLKANVFSQFPSLCGSNASPEDVIKLQNFMMEYSEMKSNIQKNNTSMKQQFTILQKWQDEIKAYKEQQEGQIKQCQEQIAKLRNENLELKKEINTKIEQIQINENIMKEENEDLVKKISEKSSIIDNMAVQIDKLEQGLHSSFEYLKRNDDEKGPEHDYIGVFEHKAIVKEFEMKLSQISSEKLELEDMRNIYIDEINCLKVNLTSAEELLRKNQADIALLKCKDVEKSELFDKYEKEKEEMKQQIDLLHTQLDIYCKDFEMERVARQNLAGEKEQLLTDLKMLQRRNQQLIEETSARLENNAKSGSSTPRNKISFGAVKKESVSSAVKPEQGQVNLHSYVCPLCNTSYPCLDNLQSHVQSCLDKE